MNRADHNEHGTLVDSSYYYVKLTQVALMVYFCKISESDFLGCLSFLSCNFYFKGIISLNYFALTMFSFKGLFLKGIISFELFRTMFFFRVCMIFADFVHLWCFRPSANMACVGHVSLFCFASYFVRIFLFVISISILWYIIFLNFLKENQEVQTYAFNLREILVILSSLICGLFFSKFGTLH